MHCDTILIYFISIVPVQRVRSAEVAYESTGRLLGKGDASLQSPIAAPTPSCSFTDRALAQGRRIIDLFRHFIPKKGFFVVVRW